MNWLSDSIEITEFDEDLEQQLIDLERSSAAPMGNTFPLTHIKACTVFYEKYSSIPSQFLKWKIVIARDKKLNKVIGVINGIIKEVYLNGDLVILGQMFGLKVHKRYQKKGIGHMLCKQMESDLEHLGAVSIYVRIESFNTDAEKLYTNRLKYHEIANQKVKLISPRSSAKQLQQITTETAYKLTKEYYDKKDMALSDIWPLFKSPYYLATYVVETSNQDIAGISLWYASGLSDMSIIQVLFDVKNLQKPHIFLLVLMSLIFILFLYFYFIYKGYYELNSRLMILLYIPAISWLSLKFLTLVFTLLKYGKFAIFRSKRRRGRTFGYFFKGRPSIQRQLTYELIEGLSREAANNKLEYILFEYSENDHMTNYFHTHNFSRIYLYKTLDETTFSGLPTLSFVDPRD
ncbi:unnamed protein product [Blepharisma stoltei]|uniref:N-acetyltransferase domain-containing protein n=1 Tax=Blepharisma stoltei TaxID=1481888 RepID=A0AAU9KH41_9CILI|nr:unnamed protein product [Blepharisma stoltei]